MKICCIEGCTNEPMPNRRYCEVHYKQRRYEQFKERVKKYGYKHIDHEIICQNCGRKFISHNFPKYCNDCIKKFNSIVLSNKYAAVKINGVTCNVHRKIAKDLDVLPNGKNDVVHHLNGNKNDNRRCNLIVLALSDHGKLHHYIKVQLSNFPDRSVEEITWEFINENGIPYYFLNDNPQDLIDEMERMYE